MKRMVGIFVLVCMLCQLAVHAFAVQTDDLQTEVISRVSGIGIINGDDEGFRLYDSITRAEFATIACRLMSIDNISKRVTGFADVPSAHWASGYVATAESLGIVNGVGDGLFAPEAEITYPEVMKIMVAILGYSVLAEEKGGWPNGYLAQAASLGLTKDTTMMDGSVLRGEIAIIINNALDANPLEPDYGGEGGHVVSDKTLYEQLSDISGTVEFEGIYQENAVSSILRDVPSCEEEVIIISGKEYRSPQLYGELLGRYVSGFAREYKKGRFEIVSIYATEHENNVTVINTDNGELTADYGVMYKDGGKETRIRILPTAKYLYNGRLTSSPASYRGLDDAEYVLIDNTGDKTADVVMIWESKSFVIDRVSEKSSSVYFKNGETFGGRRALSLIADDSEDHSYVYLTDKYGNELSPADVLEDAVVTITASEDLSLCTVKVSFDTVEGTVSTVGEDFVEIEGKEYKSVISLSVGEEGIFAIDAEGRIAGKLEGIVDMEFGYIMNAMVESGMNGRLKIQIISAIEPQKEVKIKNGSEVITYYLQNEEPQIFTCRDKIKFAIDNTSGFGSSTLSSSILTGQLINTICAYRLDSNGEITHLNVYGIHFPTTKYKFNAKIFSFAGTSRGYATNKDTKVICIPNTVNSDDDYGVRVTINNASTGEYVYGVKAVSDFDPNSSDPDEVSRYNSEEVDVLVIRTNMDSTSPILAQDDSDICIVGNVSTVVNANGDTVKKLELLKGENKVTLLTRSSGRGYDKVSALRMGDLIRYSSNGDGTISDIVHLVSAQGHQTYKIENNALKTGYTFHYGICKDILYGSYDHKMNDYVDAVTLSFGEVSEETKIVKIIEEDVKIYLYNRRLGTIESSTIDDVVTVQQSGNPTKLLALMKDDVEAVIIIQD